MKREFITTQNPQVEITIAGDLRVHGWDQNQISIEFDNEPDMQIISDGDLWKITGKSDAKIDLPQTSAVQINRVGGDAAIQSLLGTLAIGQVQGDLEVSSTSSLRAEQVGGDLSVNGARSLYANVGGDTAFNSPGLDEPGCEIKSGGDIAVSLGQSNGLNLDLSTSGQIVVSLPGFPRIVGHKSYQSKSGGGHILLRLRSGGDMVVSGGSGGDVAPGTPAGKVPQKQPQFTVGEATINPWQRAVQRVQDSLRKMGMREEMVASTIEEASISDSPQPPSTSMPESNVQVTDEERMLVLQMLQDKKISVDEAERLLQALDAHSA